MGRYARRMVMGSPFAPDAASDWWNFAATLLASAATVAAVLFSVLSTREANRRTERAERRADDAERRERKRAAAEVFSQMSRLARQVSAEASYDGGGWEDDPGRRSIAVFVKNRSGADIYDLWLTPYPPYSSVPQGRPSIIGLPDFPEGTNGESNPDYDILEPGGGWRISGQILVDPANPPLRPLVYLDFTDANEIRWRRHPSGRVERIPRLTPPYDAL